MIIKEKFSKWNGRNWIFIFLIDLEFVLCLLKLMNCLNFYGIQPYFVYFKLTTHYAH